MSFENAFQRVVMIEGGYSDHPSDTGGKTQFGITEFVARANGYTGDMRALPLATAKAIYRAQYWDIMRLDDVSVISSAVAHEVFDTGVNMGIAHAARFLQRALTALNRQGRDFPDLVPDGVMGPVTVFSLKAFAAKRGKDGETVLLRALNGQQVERYLDITEGRPANEDFFFGWLRTRVT